MDKRLTEPKAKRMAEQMSNEAAGLVMDYAGKKLSDVFRAIQETLKNRPIYQSWPSVDCETQTRFEAETLLLCVTGFSRTRFLTSLSERLTRDAAERLQGFITQRLQSMPLAYIVKKANFYGRDFEVGPGCLIPRPETELLVEEAVLWIVRNKPDAHIYDLGCGSGAISVTLALECRDVRVEAVDISEEALRIATVNATGLGVGAKVQFARKDGLQDLKERAGSDRRAERAMQTANTTQMRSETGSLLPMPISRANSGLLDVLVTNPPYIPSVDVLALDADVRDYEPHLALDGGVDGLDFYRAIFTIGDGFFVPEGKAALFMEVGINQANVLLQEFADGRYSGWQGWTFGVRQDLRNVPRVVYGERIGEK